MRFPLGRVAAGLTQKVAPENGEEEKQKKAAKLATKAGINLSNLPRHVAIIMDGNGRWAKQRKWERKLGHMEGASRVKAILDEARHMGIRYMTLYCFSTENWKRPETEIDALMKLLRDYLSTEVQEMNEAGICLNVFGDLERLPKSTQEVVHETTQTLSGNSKFYLNLCINYGGRDDILRAAKAMAVKVQKGHIQPDEITEESFTEHLYTGKIPDPDLIVRTSGEYRISNFLLWQLAYAEIYVTQVLWPDFKPKHLREAILDFQLRDRRFGFSDESQLREGL